MTAPQDIAITPDCAAVIGSVHRLVLPGCVLYRADCREVIGTVKADAIITDPPYGIGEDPATRRSTKWQRRAGMPARDWDNSTIPDVVLALPGMADVCVVWGGNYYGLPCTRGWLMWRKPDAPPSMAHGELAWTSRDQNLRVIDWSISATNAERVGHPTQKPVRVMSWSMEQVGVPEGATVFDPFMGSASTAIACIRTGRPFIGVERDPVHFNTAVERIRRELAQGDLFLGQNADVEPPSERKANA